MLTPLGYENVATSVDEAMDRCRDAGINAGRTHQYHNALFQELGHQDIEKVQYRIDTLDYPRKK
jgi:hypothetical protein